MSVTILNMSKAEQKADLSLSAAADLNFPQDLLVDYSPEMLLAMLCVGLMCKLL